MVHARLRQLRLEKGLTQEELGKILSLHKSTISLYENGRRQLDPKTTQKIAVLFGVSVDYLWGRTNVREPYRDSSSETAPEAELDDLLTRYKVSVNGRELSRAQKIAVLDAAQMVIRLSKAQAEPAPEKPDK